MNSNMANLEMGGSALNGISNRFAELKSVFESATPENQPRQHDPTDSRKKHGMKSFWEGTVQKNQVSQPEPMALRPRVQGNRTLDKKTQLQEEMAALRIQICVKSKLTQGVASTEQYEGSEKEDMKMQLIDENKAIEKEFAELCQRQEQESSMEVCTDLEKEIAALIIHRGVLQDEIKCREHCVELEAEKHYICDEIKSFQDKLTELREKMEPQWSMDYMKQLQNEMATLKSHKDVLQNDIESVESTFEQLAIVKQQCLELEDGRNRVSEENKALQAVLTEQCKEIVPQESMDHYMEKAKEISNEIEALRSNTCGLRDELERVKAILQQQVSVMEPCFELQAERDCIEKENDSICRNISVLNRKIAHEKSWEQKLDVMKVSKDVMGSENRLLKEKLKKLKEEYDAQAIKTFKYKLQADELHDMGRENYHLQQNVNNLMNDIRNSKAARDSYKQITKDDTQVKAKNKQLRKKVEKLQKELQKFQHVEEVHENFRQGLDQLREENCKLHEEIQGLNKTITNRKMLEVHMKSLRAERTWIYQRNKDLNERVMQLKEDQWEPLRDECEVWEQENYDLMRRNEKLRLKFVNEFVKGRQEEVQEILNLTLMRQHERMDKMNQKLTQEIVQLNPNADINC